MRVLFDIKMSNSTSTCQPCMQKCLANSSVHFGRKIEQVYYGHIGGTKKKNNKMVFLRKTKSCFMKIIFIAIAAMKTLFWLYKCDVIELCYAGKNWFSPYVCCGILINPFKNGHQAGLASIVLVKMFIYLLQFMAHKQRK